MTNKEFIGTQNEDKVGKMMTDMVAHGKLCKNYCKGCNESKWNCEQAVKKMLRDDVSDCYVN